jgi:hypothetical protein
MKCDLCGDVLKPSDALDVNGTKCCRECSPSIRRDRALVDQFVAWHDDLEMTGLRITRVPTLTEFQAGRWGAIVKFELPDVLGSISMRQDGQCDTDVVNISTGEHLLCTYAILNSPSEVRDHLLATYEVISRTQNGREVPL